MYEEWDESFYTAVEVQDLEDKTGTVQRVGDSVKKIAMLLSLSESKNLIISYIHMEESIEACEKLVGNVRKTTRGRKGLSQYAKHKALIITELLERPDHKITRKILSKKYWMHFDIAELDEMMKSFEASGMITASSQGNQVIYEMPKSQVDEMEKFLYGKGK